MGEPITVFHAACWPVGPVDSGCGSLCSVFMERRLYELLKLPNSGLLLTVKIQGGSEELLSGSHLADPEKEGL